MKISLSLERNNIGKNAKISPVDEVISVLTKDIDTIEESFKLKYKLSDGHTAWLDIGWGKIAIVDKDRKPVGGIAFESEGKYISTQSLKLLPVAQGLGLMQQLLQHILLEHGGIYSSSSISPGAALIFKRLADKYTGYVVWASSGARCYAPISSWKPLGIYKVFPFIKAPDGKEYPVDRLEASFGRSNVKATRVNSQHWKYGEIFISKTGKPPTGTKQLGI